MEREKDKNQNQENLISTMVKQQQQQQQMMMMMMINQQQQQLVTGIFSFHAKICSKVTFSQVCLMNIIVELKLCNPCPPFKSVIQIYNICSKDDIFISSQTFSNLLCL